VLPTEANPRGPALTKYNVLPQGKVRMDGPASIVTLVNPRRSGGFQHSSSALTATARRSEASSQPCRPRSDVFLRHGKRRPIPAVAIAQQTVGFVVANHELRLGIKAESPAQAVRRIRQVNQRG